jgi:DNA processing protein
MDELTCWLILHHAPRLGSRGTAQLVARFGSPCAALEGAAAGLWPGLDEPTLAYLRAPDLAPVEADQAWRGGAPGRHILTPRDPRYPGLLARTADPPQVLYVLGDPEVLAQPQVAVVGSRHPSPGGAETAFEFARELAAAGLVVTSGLAAGIDGAAHRGALAAGGLTVAVAGTGLDRVYPSRHRELAHRVAAEGAIVSEYWPGTPPLPDNFPRRNRIIAGLALGTLVVEAALRSGSLISARLAGEEGRQVLAVPGSIRNPLARGCHALIRDGATLVEAPADVLSELAALLPAPVRGAAQAGAAQDHAGAPVTDPDHARVLAAMGHDPVAVDTLVARSGLTAEVVSSILLLLELQGLVASHGGGRYSRVAQGT